MPVTSNAKIQSVSIVGVGLIGASWALALRQAGFAGQITGVSSPAAIEAGIAIGAISEATTLEQAARDADLIYLAQPVDRILDTIQVLGRLLQRDCLVTDGGSTKSAIVAQAARYLPGRFLGGHPMAGKEQRGAEAASADLFRGRPYVLCPATAQAPLPFEQDFRAWLAKIGADILQMSPADHDATVALTSHLPQLLSTALAETLAQSNNPHLTKVFGPGLLDMTRLALSSPDLWLSIIATNKEAISAALAQFIEILTGIRGSLDDENLRTNFQIAADYSVKLRKLSCTK